MGDKQASNEPQVVQMGTLYVKNKPYKIYEGLNVIGRNTTAAVNIKDIQISKNHAMIAVINANQHFIADFNSSNGTKLTSNKLIPLQLYPLDDNVSVQFAEISALYRIDCQESDAHSSSNDTQTSQLTQDLYLKSTQLVIQKSKRHVRFDNEKDSDSTTADDEITCDPLQHFDASNFHDATTQVMPNETLPEELPFSKSEDSFHEAETQVLEIPIPSSPGSQLTDVNSDHTVFSSNKSEISKHNEQVTERMDPPENLKTTSHKDSNNDATIENDSDESMIFEIRPEDREYYTSIMKRKKSNILKSDDEDEVAPDKENATSSSYDDIQTPVFIEQKNARKVDSDSETYYEGSINSPAGGCEDLDNESNIIPSTQEDLSEIFNYQPSSPKPGPSNNHTFESSEDSFRLGLTQLIDKADLSESCSDNKNTTLKNTSLNESHKKDNLTGPTEENLKPSENHEENRNDNLEMESQNVTIITDDVPLVNTDCKSDDIYAQPTQKVTSLNENSKNSMTVHNSNGAAQSLEDPDVTNKLANISADTEGEIYIESTQCLDEMQREVTDNIYAVPTQKLVISKQRNPILEDSIHEGQMPCKASTNVDDVNKLGSPKQHETTDIYAVPTQKLVISKQRNPILEDSIHEGQMPCKASTNVDDVDKLGSPKQHETTDNIYAVPTQKLVSSNRCNPISKDSIDEGHMPCKTSTNVEDVDKFGSPKQHELTDNIYAVPTQKLVISNRRNPIPEDSSDEGQMPCKTSTNVDVDNLGSPTSDTGSDFIIENTECMGKEVRTDVDNIYAQPTQKFHASNVSVLLKNSFEAGRGNNESKEATKTQENKNMENKLNSIFNAETEIMPHNESTSKNTSGKAINMNNKPGVSFEDPNKDADIPCPEKNYCNHIYSMETQVISYPKPLDGPKNKDMAADNLETQTEVSFSQANLEPARVLEERPANPLVAVLKSDTQEDADYVESCDEIDTIMNKKPIDDSEVTKDVSETVNDCSDLKKSKPNSQSGKIKLVDSENCMPTQIVPKCDAGGNATKENSKMEPKAKKTKSQSTPNESDIEKVKTPTVTSRKTRGASLLSKSESSKETVVATNNMTIETLDQPNSKNDSKETVKLPKKRGIQSCVPGENVADNLGQDSIMLKRSKRTILSNIDEIEQEPVATEAKAVSDETSQLSRKKSTRSSRSSKCNEIQLTSKPPKRNSRIIPSSLKANQSSQNSSGDEFEKPSEASTDSTSKQDKIGLKCDSKSSTKEEKVIKSKKISRTGKTMDVLSEERQDKDDEVTKTSDGDGKQELPQEKLLCAKSSSRTSSPASTGSGVSLPEAQAVSTRKRSQRVPTKSSKLLAKEITSTPEVQEANRNRKHEVSRSEASSTSSTPLAEDTAIQKIQTKSSTRSTKPLAKDITSTPQVQTTRRKRKQEVSRTEALSTSSTPIVEDADIPQIQTPVRKGRQKLSSTGSFSMNSPSVSSNKLEIIPEAHLPSKKRRQNIVEIENTSSSSSENIRSSSASSSAMNTPERKKRALKPKVVFTMMDSPLLESIIRQLGGSVVDSIAACTVLVTEKIKRTMKLLTAIGLAKPICSPKWIHESKKARQFLDPWDFILNDAEAEGKWTFSLSDSLHRSTNIKLMEGLNFHILATDNIADVLKNAIEACGGRCLHRITKGDASKSIFIVTPEECRSKCLKLKKQHKNTTAIDPEGVFESVLKQELTLKDHFIDV